MELVGGLRRAGRGVLWFVRGIVREDAYEKYLAHVETAHAAGGAGQSMTEREFWRDLADRQDTNPQGRCC